MGAGSDTTRHFVVLSGPTGSGKSRLADGIGRALGIPVLSVDPIESAIVEAGIRQGFETGLAAYLVARNLADEYLAAGLGVVIDAANYVDEGREIWRALARRHHVSMAVVQCVVRDPLVHLERLRMRNRGLAIPEPTAADVETQRRQWVEWPEPHIVLDELASSEENLRLALTFLG